ncbi:MAG: hypothetical protein PHF97_04355 [Bacteroidales bacterium]|nr:hypothetical protein [Bacteroidales bacterium]MDD4603019.1 hypothetical protein [Bacteroidales bacterium]
MKTRLIFVMLTVAVIPVLFFTSCSKIKDLASVDVNYNVPRVSFVYTPATLKGSGTEVVLYEGHVHVNVDSLLSANGISTGTIGRATFNAVSITIQSPDTANFGWLQSARVVISSSGTFNSPVVIGTVTNSNPLAKTIIFVMNNTNIQPYFGSTGFYLRIYAVLNGTVPYNWIGMYLDSQMTLHLEAI